MSLSRSLCMSSCLGPINKLEIPQDYILEPKTERLERWSGDIELNLWCLTRYPKGMSTYLVRKQSVWCEAAFLEGAAPPWWWLQYLLAPAEDNRGSKKSIHYLEYCSSPQGQCSHMRAFQSFVWGQSRQLSTTTLARSEVRGIACLYAQSVSTFTSLWPKSSRKLLYNYPRRLGFEVR